MALPDPLTIIFDTVSKSLPRSGSSPNESVYRLEDGSVIHTVRVSHQFGNPTGGRKGQQQGKANAVRRAVIRYEQEFLVSDPLVSGQSRRSLVTATLTLTWDELVAAADAAKRGKVVSDWSTLANLQKICGGET